MELQKWPCWRAAHEEVKLRNNTTFITKTDDKVIEDRAQNSRTGQNCPHCKLMHDIENCEALKQKSTEFRLKTIRDNRLCFGCLQFGHFSKQCRNRKTCQYCFRKHPTILHAEGTSQQFKNLRHEPNSTGHEATSNSADPSNESDQMCYSITDDHVGPVMSILPVVITGPNQRSLETYGFLDNGSSATFITTSLADDLGLYGEDTTLTLTTVEREKSCIKSRILSGLQVSDIDGNHTLSLPPAFTIKKIPLSRSDVPDVKMLNVWQHLNKLKIPELEMEHIGILIGCDCPQAMEPWEVIHSKDGGPYALKTILGWTVVGPRSPSKTLRKSKTRVNRTEVFTNEVKKLLVAMYNNDFTEKIDCEPTLSQEDRQCKSKVTNSIKMINGRYEIELPFRESIVKFPNNRKLAERRAEGLKKRFLRYPDIHARYSDYMKQLIIDGHAEIVPKFTIDGDSRENILENVWYLPHHGVRHPSKPEKTRVVFDCSARYGGISLNDELLQGPDLTNNLIGVLLRFREETVAFMADIKAMYHQVRVPEKQADYLRFLWWPDGKIDEPLEEYRMRVHLFGAVSSPSCANFALRQTAKDHSLKYGGLPTKNTIEKKIYVDDCLKSVKTSEEAIQLIHNIIGVCENGGFHLTKFVSNKEIVVKSVPAEDRASN